jgi:hypothetical protein
MKLNILCKSNLPLFFKTRPVCFPPQVVIVYDNEFIWEYAREWKLIQTQGDARVLDRFGPPGG